MLKVRLRVPVENGKMRNVSIISVYAPTFQTAQDEKDAFWAALADMVRSVAVNDVFVMAGDFNARVGSGSAAGVAVPQWRGVRGLYGHGEVNDNGESMLDFCQAQGLAVVNTFFKKKVIHDVAARFDEEVVHAGLRGRPLSTARCFSRLRCAG